MITAKEFQESIKNNKFRDESFLQVLKQLNLPVPHKEYRYARKRKFRVDFAYPEIRMGIEIDGGIFNKKAHGSITGILNDIDRNNTAAMEGWTMIRIPSSHIHEIKYKEALVVTYERLQKEREMVSSIEHSS